MPTTVELDRELERMYNYIERQVWEYLNENCPIKMPTRKNANRKKWHKQREDWLYENNKVLWKIKNQIIFAELVRRGEWKY